MDSVTNFDIERVADEAARCSILTAERMKDRLAAADRIGAMRILHDLCEQPALVEEVMLRAGLSTVGHRSRHFWTHAQEQICKACHSSTLQGN